MRRSRSNDGTPSHVENVLPISQRDLARLLAIFRSKPREKREPRIFHGPRAPGGHPAIRFTDEQVIEIRKLREWRGMSAAAISKLLDLELNSVTPITEWRNRVHLDPGPRPEKD